MVKKENKNQKNLRKPQLLLLLSLEKILVASKNELFIDSA